MCYTVTPLLAAVRCPPSGPPRRLLDAVNPISDQLTEARDDLVAIKDVWDCTQVRTLKHATPSAIELYQGLLGSWHCPVIPLFVRALIYHSC